MILFLGKRLDWVRIINVFPLHPICAHLESESSPLHYPLLKRSIFGPNNHVLNVITTQAIEPNFRLNCDCNCIFFAMNRNNICFSRTSNTH